MGKGQTSFRDPGWVGVVCVVLAVGCRSSRESDDLRSLLQVSHEDGTSLVTGHLFGNWLEVEPDALAGSVLEHACVLEQYGRSEEAINLLGDELDGGSKCASLFEARGALYLATGYPRAASGDFQRAAALAPERARCWYALGHAYEALGLGRQALEALEHARSLGAGDDGLFLSLARVYRSLGRAGQSARHYRIALERLGDPSPELLAEAALLAAEDPARSAKVETMRDRLEACRGTSLSDDAWFLRALLRETPSEASRDIAATFQALEVAPAELETLTEGLLTSVQLVDPETSAEARAELLAREKDERVRTALERCLGTQ